VTSTYQRRVPDDGVGVELLGGELNGEDGMRSGGAIVHGGGRHLAVGLSLQQQTLGHVLAGRQVGRHVPHDTWATLPLEHRHLVDTRNSTWSLSKV